MLAVLRQHTNALLLASSKRVKVKAEQGGSDSSSDVEILLVRNMMFSVLFKQ